MATLTETAKVTRLVIKVGIAVVISLIVGRIIMYYAVMIYKAMVPVPPPPATVGFGSLPRLMFPTDDRIGLTYKLETVDGSVPSFGLDAKVFLVSQPQTSILGLDRGKQKAAALGFVFEPKQISGTYYRWTNTSPLPASLDLDYTTGNFEMKVSWETSPRLLDETLIPNEVQAISEVKNYVKQAGLLSADMVNGRAKAKYLKYSGGEMVEAISLSEADFVRVDVFRENIDEMKVLPADPNKGLVHAIISGSRERGERIILAEFLHTQVEYEQFETYPIITGNVAWQKLVGGQGFVAVAPESGSDAIVRRVSFGFYDCLDDQQYMQPIYVFEGDGGFVGYVPAVTDEWVQ